MSDENPLSEQELTSAVEMLRKLLPNEELHRLQPCGPATIDTATIDTTMIDTTMIDTTMIDTTMITLWMMTLQRLGGGKPLNAIVKDVLSHSRELLPDNKRLREGTLSETSGASADARTRLKLETVEFFANRVCDSLIAASPPWFDGRRGITFDGTTMTLEPTPELQAAFPPATNQHGESVWPVAYNLVVQFRRQAAKLADVAPRRLSFTGVWNTFESFLLTKPPCHASEWQSRYQAALQIASRDKLPNRPGRSDPRRAHPRRPKSTKFMKQQSQLNKNPPPEKPK